MLRCGALGRNVLTMLKSLVSTSLITLCLQGGVTMALDDVPKRPADLVLEGELRGEDHRRIRLLPFEVPNGVESLAVRFDYDGKETKTVIDIGLNGPKGFRGWSGGNKSQFQIGPLVATPSYLVGQVDPGRWELVLGIPNIRAESKASYRAEIWMEKRQYLPKERRVEAREAGWFRGDLHLHTGHSDGSCKSQAGKRIPCPLFKTVQQAVDQGLDFISITEHNTISHLQAIHEIEGYFDQIVVLPGVELTTFWGHVNLVGVMGHVDYVRASKSPDDVVNGGAVRSTFGQVEGPFSGFGHWVAALSAGRSVTAIGSSDNHDPTQIAETMGAIGRPATVVFATELSAPAIMTGLRSGRAFVDLDGVKGRILDLRLNGPSGAVTMGSSLSITKDMALSATLSAVNLPADATVQWMRNGEAMFSESVNSRENNVELTIRLPELSPGTHAVYVIVRKDSGRISAMTNPV
ncbi:MAG: hypothetical protein EBS52_11485, partial [Betaproteobacteria bacterium]|nr:hypothetical protein [Betaproteobacteria bacterium]